MVLICHMISQYHVIKVSCEFTVTSPSNYHYVNFGGHRHGVSGDIIVLVCHVISLNLVIKKPCYFMGRSLSSYATILQS